LLLYGVDDTGRGVANRYDRDARPKVDQLVTVNVDDDAAASAFHVDRQQRAHSSRHGRHLALV
jgi:hypothetical protein